MIQRYRAASQPSPKVHESPSRKVCVQTLPLPKRGRSGGATCAPHKELCHAKKQGARAPPCVRHVTRSREIKLRKAWHAGARPRGRKTRAQERPDAMRHDTPTPTPGRLRRHGEAPKSLVCGLQSSGRLGMRPSPLLLRNRVLSSSRRHGRRHLQSMRHGATRRASVELGDARVEVHVLLGRLGPRNVRLHAHSTHSTRVACKLSIEPHAEEARWSSGVRAQSLAHEQGQRGRLSERCDATTQDRRQEAGVAGSPACCAG